jgi:hypothetical protein
LASYRGSSKISLKKIQQAKTRDYRDLRKEDRRGLYVHARGRLKEISDPVGGWVRG